GLEVLGQIVAQALYLGGLRQALGGTTADAPPVVAQPPGDARLLVADLVRQSSEAFTRLVRGFYQVLLGRLPEPGEEAGWVGMFLNGHTQEQVLSALLGTADFAERAEALVATGTAEERLLGAMYLLLLRRPASEEETQSWTAALGTLGARRLLPARLGGVPHAADRRLLPGVRAAAGHARGAGRLGGVAVRPFDDPHGLRDAARAVPGRRTVLR